MTALQQLRQAEVDTLYLRLADQNSGQLYNRLFDQDFVLPGAPVEEIEFQRARTAGQRGCRGNVRLAVGSGEFAGETAAHRGTRLF